MMAFCNDNSTWQGEEYVNQTFGDELNFDPEEIESIYESQEEQDEKA